MLEEQLQNQEQVTAEQLSIAMDELLFRFGQEGPDRTVSASYILPGSEDVKIESRPYGRLGRYEGKDGSHKYTVETIIPHNGGSKKALSFKDGKAYAHSESWEQIGEHDQESHHSEGELTPEAINNLYKEITNPLIVPRERAIDGHYHQKHYSRSKVGRFIARARGSDRPRHF